MTNSEIITALKSGEYDGTHIMQAWCRIRQQQERIAELEKLVDELLDVEHKFGGSLHLCGQFVYKTPESVFKLAAKLKEHKK